MYTYKIEYTAEGHFFNMYSGTFTHNSNYEDIEEVEQQAINKIANTGAFNRSMITIKSITRI